MSSKTMGTLASAVAAPLPFQRIPPGLDAAIASTSRNAGFLRAMASVDQTVPRGALATLNNIAAINSKLDPTMSPGLSAAARDFSKITAELSAFTGVSNVVGAQKMSAGALATLNKPSRSLRVPTIETPTRVSYFLHHTSGS